MDSEIQKFFQSKRVFLTGGTGFLGKVFIEKLLRATDVECIYMLVRPKNGRDVQERINDIFKDPLFDQMHKLVGNPAKRIVPIFGDCVLPHLGLSSEDRTTLIENVDVIVHSAATVRFNEPMSYALAINVRATIDLLQLAKKMFKLKAFVHVSSAFANCVVPHVEERFYTQKLGITAEQVCKLGDILGADILNRMSGELLKDFPNTYCYTKALAEEAVLSLGSELPICIFRPSIVVPTCKEPLLGWIDNLYGPISILYGVSHGVLRVMYVHTESKATIVPVDYCVNTMLACAWSTAKSVKQIQDSPPAIYHLVPDEQNIRRWEDYVQSVEEHGYSMPIKRMIWYPFLIRTKSKFLYQMLCFFYHTIPGYIFDFLLLLLGKKRRMVKTYRKIHKQTALLDYFAENEWTFSSDNTKQLWKSLSDEDKKLFTFDMQSFNWAEYFYNSLCGMRRFLSKEEPTTIPKNVQLLKRLLFLHRVTQVFVYGGGSFLLLWIYQSTLKLF